MYDDRVDDELATAAEPHKGNPVRSLPPVPPAPDLTAVRPPQNLYRQSTPTVHHGHFGTITAEPAMLDVPTSRYIEIQNRGPAELYLSNTEGAPAFHTLAAPTADEPGDTYLIEGRVFLRSAGDSSVHVAEFFNQERAA